MDSTKYRIPLDAIDLNFLPITYSRNFSNPTSLWRYGLDTNEYFEFEIREKTDRSEFSEATETIACHICNLNVPKSFLSDHYRSNKHFINKRIADTALERTRKHLGGVKETDYVNNNNNVYFCSECVAVVQIKDRQSHEKQQSHKNSVILDRLLSEFHLMYANDDDEAKTDPLYYNDDTINDLDFSEVEKSDDFSKASDFVQSKVDTEPVNTEKKADHCDESNWQSVSDNRRSAKEKLNAHEILNNNTKEISKSNRFSVLDTKNKTSDTESSSTTKPDTSINGIEQDDLYSSVNADSEAKYLSIIGDVFICKVCFTKFDISCLKSHINGSRHKMNKISDVHYMMKESGDELYCIVCSKILANTVEGAKEHCNDPSHVSSYEKNIRENGIRLRADTLYCELCDINISKRNEFIHIFDKRHYKRKTQKTDNFYCNVCEKYIPNTDVNKHDNSIEHQIRIKSKKEDFINGEDKYVTIAKEKTKESVVSTNEIVDEIKNRPYFCVICQVNVPSGTKCIEIHNNGAPHKKKQKCIESTRSLNNESTTESKGDNYTCDVCRVTLSNNDKCIYEHNHGAAHIKKLKKSQMQKIELQLVNINQNEYEIRTETEAASQLQQNSAKSVQQPTTSPQNPTIANQQATTSTQLVSTSTEQLTSSSQQLTSAENPTISTQQPTSWSQQLKSLLKPSTSAKQQPTVTLKPSYLTPHPKSKIQQTTPTHSAVTQVMCKVCNVKVPNKKNCITEHGKGKVHQNNYKQTLASENIVQKDDKYYCIICSLDIDNPITHITESAHKSGKKLFDTLKTCLWTKPCQ